MAYAAKTDVSVEKTEAELKAMIRRYGATSFMAFDEPGCPHEYRATSWGRKVWGKAATAYLTKMGMASRVSTPSLPLSPLERMMQRGQRHD